MLQFYCEILSSEQREVLNLLLGGFLDVKINNPRRDKIVGISEQTVAKINQLFPKWQEQILKIGNDKKGKYCDSFDSEHEGGLYHDS